MRRLQWLIPIALVFALSSCTPVANWTRDLVNAPDGAVVEYLTDGVGFAPGSEAALGTILVVTGDNITTGDERCEREATMRWDCTLGDVTEPTVVLLTGQDVLALATFRRDGSNTVYTAIGE